MFNAGDNINGKYLVLSVCNDTGGMGTLLHVNPIWMSYPNPIVLKFCKEKDEEYVLRFKREVRVLNEFKGNSRIIEILDYDTEHDPPYFVMKYYPDGDLTTLSSVIASDLVVQEQIFTAMIDCIAEIHSTNRFHRDIKPQNFLLDGGVILASDFGLVVEKGSKTGFTKSSQYWGTNSYIPPEFFETGGFRDADAASDIFMLGKSFYALLTGRDPMYIIDTGTIPAPIYHVIDRCCVLNKASRYQSLAELKQSLVAAYDVLLNRGNSITNVNQSMLEIYDRLSNDNKYEINKVETFVEQLALLEECDKLNVCLNLDIRIFSILSQSVLNHILLPFLNEYEKMVQSGSYSWSFAETIATNMRIIFDSVAPFPAKSKALALAIEAAGKMNRFAAMDTCFAMITSVTDEQLGLVVGDIIKQAGYSFLTSLERSSCNSEAVRKAVASIKETNE